MSSARPHGARAVEQRRALGHHPIAAQRERNARIREQVEAIAQTAITQAPSATSEGAVDVIGVIPANTRETTRLPAATRRIFLSRLAERLHAVFSTVPTSDAAAMTAQRIAAMDPPPSDRADAATILGLSCGTCRGECCTAGGDHAFLRADSLIRVREQHPEANEGALLASYAAYLPTRHYRGSCVYHTTAGCALPRAMRSNICNRYLCGGLTQLKRALESVEGNAAFVGAADSVHLRRMARIDVHGAKPITLK